MKVLSCFEVFSELKNLKEIRDSIDKDVRMFFCNEKDIYSLVVSVDEVCSNIIRHAYLEKHSERIVITTSTDETFFFITIEHFGKGFDYSSHQYIPVNERHGNTKKGGFGLKLVSVFIDHVEYSETSHSVRITLKKKLPTP